jgi:hypothetical protein
MPDENRGSRVAVKYFDASVGDSSSLNCLACEHAITDANWFARIKLGNHRAVFCCPRCVEIYLDHAEAFAKRLEH